MWRWGGWEDVSTACAGTSPQKRNPWKSNCKRRWMSAVSPSMQLLGTAFGYNVISQASLFIWFMPLKFITVVDIDIHWGHTGLEGSSALPDSVYTSMPHVLKWQCPILMRCLLVPGFLEASGDPRIRWPMQCNGTGTSISNLQVQMQIVHPDTGLASSSGRCVTELASITGSIYVLNIRHMLRYLAESGTQGK